MVLLTCNLRIDHYIVFDITINNYVELLSRDMPHCITYLHIKLVTTDANDSN